MIHECAASDWQAKTEEFENKPFPGATLSTTIARSTDPGVNSGHRGEKPVTNRLSHGTAMFILLLAMNVHICTVAHSSIKTLIKSLFRKDCQ
jgi:hypothetical protein